jgi:hypothetical protein
MLLIYDPQYWCNRAEEARIVASTMITADGRETMLEVARLHDRMAAMAERIHERDRVLTPPGGRQGLVLVEPAP